MRTGALSICLDELGMITGWIALVNTLNYLILCVHLIGFMAGSS